MAASDLTRGCKRTSPKMARLSTIFKVGVVALLLPVVMAMTCPLTVAVTCPADGAGGVAVTVTVNITGGSGTVTTSTTATGGTVTDGSSATPSVTPDADGGTVTVITTGADDAGAATTATCTFTAVAAGCDTAADCDDDEDTLIRLEGVLCTTPIALKMSSSDAHLTLVYDEDNEWGGILVADGELFDTEDASAWETYTSEHDFYLLIGFSNPGFDGPEPTPPLTVTEIFDSLLASREIGGVVGFVEHGRGEEVKINALDWTRQYIDSSVKLPIHSYYGGGWPLPPADPDSIDSCEGGMLEGRIQGTFDVLKLADSYCGDGLCIPRIGEDSLSCPEDCGCEVDADCDDGLFCTGTEICNADTGCESSGDPCDAGKNCDEDTNTCERAEPKDGKLILHVGNGVTMELVRISAGTFMMGGDPVHQVDIAQEFYMGKHEVTQAQWEAVMGNNPSAFGGCDSCPVEKVSWENAVEFCDTLSSMTGYEVHLPSEAKWEYACRAGTTTKYSFGDDTSVLGDYAWFDENSGAQTHEVGTKFPNPWALYDMSGNVSEWCQDKRHDDYTGAPTDGSAWIIDGSSMRVLRGGSWSNRIIYMGSGYRAFGTPGLHWSSIGFRVVADCQGNCDLTSDCDPACPLDETCNHGACTSQPIACAVDVDCDDGRICNGIEQCTAGRCVDGTPPCDDYEEPCEERNGAAFCVVYEPNAVELHADVVTVENDYIDFCGPQDIQVGDVLYGYDPGVQVVRRITGVTPVGGCLRASTVEAVLDDAIQQGSISWNSQLVIPDRDSFGNRTPSGTRMGHAFSQDGRLSLNDVVIYESSSLTVTILSGYAEFLPTFAGEAHWAQDGPLVAGFVDMDGVLRLSLKVEVSASVDFDFGHEVLIVPPFVVPFPLGTVEFFFHGGFEVDIDAAGTAVFDVYSEHNIGFRAEYDGSWSRVSKRISDNRVELGSWNVEAGISARIYVRPELAVKLLGVAGGSVDLQPYVYGDAFFSTASWWWELGYGIKGNVHLKLGVLHYDLVEYPFQLFDWRSPDPIAGEEGYCGDLECEFLETCSLCSQDCCDGPVCDNDGVCGLGENNANCPSDCPACDNNGVCESGETCSNCPVDCCDEGKVYWADTFNMKIQHANLDGSEVEDVITGILPKDITLDTSGGKIYWTDGGPCNIQRANLDGSNPEDLVCPGLPGAQGIALDTSGGRIYWTENGENRIRRANLDGTNIEDLADAVLPGGIALDVGSGKMYWTEDAYATESGKVKRANLDGSNVEVLIDTGEPQYIAIDPSAGKMYWTDFDPPAIKRANLNGSSVEVLVTADLWGHNGIALDISAGKMYWTYGTAITTKKIQRANLDGSQVEDLVTSGLSSPNGIALIITGGD